MSNWKLQLKIQRMDMGIFQWEYDDQNTPTIFIDPPIEFVDLYFDIKTSQITEQGLAKIDKAFIKEHHFNIYNYLNLHDPNSEINVISIELVNMCPKISFMRDYYNEKKARLDSLIYEPCKFGPDCKQRMMCRYMH